MRQLKILDSYFDLYGIQFGIPLCCLIWFGNVQCTIRATIPEYASTMSKLTNNAGVILCPNCLFSTLNMT